METGGERLKRLRLEKGLSLEDVHKKIRVQLNILKAIEGDSITNLSPIYLKSFLKIYCNFLGVDWREYIDKDKGKEPAEPLQKEFPSPAPTAAREEKGRPQQVLKVPSVDLGSPSPAKKIKIIALILSGILLACLFLFALGRFLALKKSPAAKAKPPVTASAVKKAPSAAKAQPAKAASASQAVQIKPAASLKVGMRAREDCWAYVKIDGKVVFSQILKKGYYENWTAKEKAQISLGNAGAITLEVNGQLFSNLGRKGEQLKNITISKEGLVIPR